MKKITYSLAFMLAAITGFAQTDTSKATPDTIKAGNFIIVKKGGNTEDTNWHHRSFNINIGSHHTVTHTNTSTNWFVFDLGFANVRDETTYSTPAANAFLRTIRTGEAPFTKSDLKLKTRSSNVNIWVFMQRLNVVKHVVNFKYGLGLEMYNFRYENNISYHKSPTYIFRDSVNFSKNKLYAGYLTVPFMLNINATPHKHEGFSFSAGVSAGYLVGSHTKQVSEERGKRKIKGDFDLEKWRLAAIGELGLGPIRLYGSYSINALHENGLTQYPYAIGIRFTKL
ncbi:MAG: outer rane beta-barrel protein [Chitinophagaceae bacterium]|nr:outer rane beta-barrel protein [Chitinophagaceae bacterium]